MQSQFFKVLDNFCQRRSSQTSGIRWWFSGRRSNAQRAGDFPDEGTRPFGLHEAPQPDLCPDDDASTLEDAPMSPELWQQLSVG